MKKLITLTMLTLLVTHTVVIKAQPVEKPKVVVAKLIDGKVIPFVQLPEIEIKPDFSTTYMAYELQEVTITAQRNLTGLYPATQWQNQYIASVSLPEITISARHKKSALASIFTFEWLFKK
jgi:hypothetical protein